MKALRALVRKGAAGRLSFASLSVHPRAKRSVRTGEPVGSVCVSVMSPGKGTELHMTPEEAIELANELTRRAAEAVRLANDARLAKVRAGEG